MLRSISRVFLAIVFAAVFAGCHHQVQTAKTPPSPPPQPAPSASTSAPAPAAQPSAPATVTKQPTDEELFARNVKDIFFNYDKADIRNDETSAVDADAQFLLQHPALKVVIEGHCDERGSEEYNMALGQNRAGDVRDALLRQGITADRIKLISFGKERPFCSTAENESCWQQNRRAHFVLQNQQRASN